MSLYLKDCILTIKVRSLKFQIGDTFGIPVTVKDVVTNDVIVGPSTKYAYKSLMGRVTVLVRFILGCSTKFLFDLKKARNQMRLMHI